LGWCDRLRKSLDFRQALRWKNPMVRRLPRLFRISGLLLICLAFFALAGGHWAVFQAIAWAQMMREYSKSVSIAEAIVKTFGGAYPCGMCTKISAERQKEEKPPSVVKVEKKAEMCPLSVREILNEPGGREYSYPDARAFALVERFEAPPVPVPIGT
jgi:hypothetical protein